MSTRWYPLYQRGNPQLRVFLPNFWMKLVRPKYEQPPNVVQFACSMEMTKHDIKNYLEKIYNVKCVAVRVNITAGSTRRDVGKGFIVKNDDIKHAYITLPKGQEFHFPELYPDINKDKDDYDKAIKETEENFKQFLEKSKQRPNVPGWFTI